MFEDIPCGSVQSAAHRGRAAPWRCPRRRSRRVRSRAPAVDLDGTLVPDVLDEARASGPKVVRTPRHALTACTNDQREHCSSRRANSLLYRMLADLVVVTHVVFIAFVAVGSLLVSRAASAVAAPRRRRWAAPIVTVGFTCPLTPFEKHFREQAGHSAYDGGFVDHYLEGVIYPGRFTAVARLLVAIPDRRRLRSCAPRSPPTSQAPSWPPRKRRRRSRRDVTAPGRTRR